MSKYKIEYQILTLADCGVMESGKKPASFEIDGITFSHIGFDNIKGWSTNNWLATEILEKNNIDETYLYFVSKLTRIIPRISLIAQAYIEYLSEPFLIYKEGSNIAFFRYIENAGPVSLMFEENNLEALKILLKNTDIPESFYYYWNDAVNTTGYSAKLLLMFSAIEALVKKNGKKDWALIEFILGKGLTDQIFTKNTGLRHRLVHGEYFEKKDGQDDYLKLLHDKVIGYFNGKILSKDLILSGVVGPQRNLFGNKNEFYCYVKRKDGETDFLLNELCDDFSANGLNGLKEYEIVQKSSLKEIY